VRRPDGRWCRAALAAPLAALAVAAAVRAGDGEAAARASVALVAFDCSSERLVCPPFVAAARRTGTRVRIVSPDPREDVAATFALLAGQGYDLIVSDFNFAQAGPLAMAGRFPDQRFAVVDPPFEVVRRPANVTVLRIRPRKAAYLAGWLAGRMERRRPGPDVVGVVGGWPVLPVEDFIVGFRAGARRAAPGVRVITGYSHSFIDQSACAAIAEGQIARGAGTVFDVAGACGQGTLAAARGAGIWAIGVDRDRSGLGPHILTSVVKRYDRAFALLMRRAADAGAPDGGNLDLGLARGGAELGRISPRVPRGILRELAEVRRDVLAGRIRVPAA
jgi:basic membrane protein A